MNIWETFILFFSFQSVIFGTILFFKKKGNRTSHYIWGSFLFLFAYNIFFNVLFWSRVNPRLFILLQSSYVLCMALYGPLFYLYIRSLIKEQNLNWKDAVHFIPFLLALHHCEGFLFRSIEFKKEIIQNGQFQDMLVYGPYFEYLLVLIMIGYGIAALLIFRKAGKRESSDVYTWLKAITGTYIAFCLSWVVYYILVREKILLTEHDYIITFFMIVFISITTYVGIEHPSIFNGKPFKELVPFVKYEKTGLSKRRSLEWKKKLETFMNKEKPYLNAELRLDDLAEDLGFSRHHTSQIINEHYEMSFFEFINYHRIKEAAQLLICSDGDSFQITEIAYQVGFNNRTSFYKSFKKEYGVTPSEFRKQNEHQRILDNSQMIRS